jgi:CubicO group peptidase (beta-lactamase class C family)
MTPSKIFASPEPKNWRNSTDALLTHTGGMPAIPALQRYFPDPAHLDRDVAFSRLFSIEPESPAGRHVMYSCTGYRFWAPCLSESQGCL